MKYLLVLFLILNCLGFGSTALARTEDNWSQVRLFKENGKYVRNYQRLVKKLAQDWGARENPAPVELEFSHGTKIKVDKFLGEGGAHYVFSIADSELVLRLRKFKLKRFAFYALNLFTIIDTLGEIERDYSRFTVDGVKLPKLYTTQTNKGQFLIHEKIDFQYDYWDYLNNQEIPGEKRKKMDEAFLKFVRSTAQYRKIGDFKNDQLVYSEKGYWVLLDYMEGTERAQSVEDGNIFIRDERDIVLSRAQSYSNGPILEPIERKPGLPDYMKEVVLKAIKNQRTQYFSSCKNI